MNIELPTMPPFEERAESVLSFMYRGIHHCQKITKHGSHWEVNHFGQLSTFDFDELTRLVIAAHDLCIRATICASGPRMVKIMLHNREGREGRIYERHPTIEQSLESMKDRVVLEETLKAITQ